MWGERGRRRAARVPPLKISKNFVHKNVKKHEKSGPPSLDFLQPQVPLKRISKWLCIYIKRLFTKFFKKLIFHLGLVVPPASSSGPKINVVARKEVETVTPAKPIENEEEDKNKEVELI